MNPKSFKLIYFGLDENYLNILQEYIDDCPHIVHLMGENDYTQVLFNFIYHIYELNALNHSSNL